MLKFLYKHQRNPESEDGNNKMDAVQETSEDKPLQVVASIAAA